MEDLDLVERDAAARGCGGTPRGSRSLRRSRGGDAPSMRLRASAPAARRRDARSCAPATFSRISRSTAGQIRVVDDQVQRSARIRPPRPPSARRSTAAESMKLPFRQVLVVAREDALELLELPRIAERLRRQRRRREARRADLFEGALQRPMEARPVAQLSEVGLRLEVLRAGLLDERQRLRAREQAESLPGERRSRDARGRSCGWFRRGG